MPADVEIVVMGTSLGGFNALQVILGGLSAAFHTPVAVVQHQGGGGSELAVLLQRHCALRICEPEDKMMIEPGTVYLAPAGYHLLVERGSFALSTDPPVLYARPSIDVLFESAAEAYGPGTLGVALTAASPDGAAGMAKIKACGGMTIVQDPATAESRVLSDAVLATVQVDRVLPLRKIAPYLILACQRRSRSLA